MPKLTINQAKRLKEQHGNGPAATPADINRAKAKFTDPKRGYTAAEFKAIVEDQLGPSPTRRKLNALLQELGNQPESKEKRKARKKKPTKVTKNVRVGR